MHDELKATLEQLGAALELKDEKATLAAALRFVVHGLRQLEQISTALNEIARLQEVQASSLERLGTVIYSK